MTRDIENIDDDISRMKRLIRQKLTSDSDVIEVLNNQELDPSSPDDYLDTNIFAYIRIPTVQDVARNFICFSVDDMEDHRDNSVLKIQYVQFVVFCHGDDIKTPYGIERHDLLGLIKWPLYTEMCIENPLNCSKPLRAILLQHRP